MKPRFAALMASLLSGCAAQSWRFAEDRPRPPSDADRTTLVGSVPIRQTALSPTAAATASSSESTDREDASRSVYQSPKRPRGLIDPLVDRIPSLLSGTLLEPPPMPTLSAVPSFAGQDSIELASFDQVSQRGLVYLPDEGGALLPSGRQAVWVGVQGADGDPVDVVIDDGNRSAPQRSLFARAMDYPIVYNLVTDERNFYSCCSLEWLAAGLGTSAILANTNLDEQFRQSIHGPAHKNSTDLNWMKDLGTGQYVIPALAGIWVADVLLESTAPGQRPVVEGLEEWSGRSLRGLIVGAVPVVALQSIIGSSRPGMSSAGSRWTPFQSSHGVSGHAFVGAVPFWTAAQMTDCVPLEAGFYAMGSLAGISRLHTDSHYLSQVVMGWWIAGLSVAAVDCTEWQKRSWEVMPMITDGGAGMAVMHQW